MPHRSLFERALAHATTYRDSLAARAPRPVASAAELEALFGGPLPEAPADPLATLDALAAAAEPGLTSAAGSRFFGWVIGGSLDVGVAADVMTSAWGQNAGLYACSPAGCMAEKAVAAWLLDLLRLPLDCSVGFTTGATMASFTCLAAARGAVLARVGWDVEADGLAGAPPVRIFLGAEAHATIVSALRYLGFGARSPRIIPTDDQGRMDAGALAAALREGSGPAIVIAQAGQINTGAFDPIGEIARACRAAGAWLHVDGAFGLWARVLRDRDALTEGVELADSWAVDGHKWLQLPYDAAFAIVRDPAAHRRAMAIEASYLPPADGAEYDPGQFVPELSRRARGFAAWAVIRTLGRQGVAEMVGRHCALARRLAERLAAEPGISVLNEVVLNQLILAFGEGSEATDAVIAEIQAENAVLTAGADWRGRRVMRVSVISAPLTETDIDRLASCILRAWRKVRARGDAARPLAASTPESAS